MSEKQKPAELDGVEIMLPEYLPKKKITRYRPRRSTMTKEEKARTPDPKDPSRNLLGQIFAGHNSGGKGYIPAIRAELSRAVIASQSQADVVQVLESIREMALHSDNQYVRLAAAQEYLNRTVGRTVKEIQIEKTEVKTTTTLDLSKLTPAELQAYDALANKLIGQSDNPEVIEANYIIHPPEQEAVAADDHTAD